MSPPHTKLWFQAFAIHTLSFMQASSAISFRLLPGSISAAASSGSPLLSGFRFLAFAFWLSLSGFSGLNFFPLSLLSVDFLTPAVFAPFRSLQFWVLTTQPLFLLFPFLPVSASQWLPQCSALTFDPSVFPVLSCLVSRAFLPGSGTQLRCMFLFALPRFAPTAVPRVLAFRFRFPHFPHPVSLSFVRSSFASGYSAFCFFLSVLPVSASQWLPRCCRSAFASLLSPFLPGWFPIRSLSVSVLGFLLVSFRPALLHSRSCSTGDPLLDLSSGAGA